MRFTRNVLTYTILTLGFSGTASADFVGLNIGTKHWTPDLTGSFSSSGDSSIDLKNDLGFSDTSSTTLNISIEHPVPLLPNVKYQNYDLNTSSNSNVTSPIVFDGTSYTGDINSTLDLTHNEIVLYYELLDNWVNLDLGLDLRVFDGKVSVSDSSATPVSTIDVDETIPMLYLSARFDLPMTGFYVGANIQQISIGDNSSEDSSLMVGYESKLGLGIEGGIKTFNLELDDADDLNTNLEYDGVYLNGYFHF
ncbi:MAG: TIGR04219 family outer membrane beta-barrel protein [Gammaproteobacteria bacterium]|nr:TIGR04219 family outer membrane beta-barrel protein [Gammaproteobacteria bacterium]